MAGAVIISVNTLYSVTAYGGTNGDGTIFKVNTDSTGFSSMFSFNSTNGSTPSAELLLVGNTLYGTCRFGGLGNGGDLFSINTNNGNFNNFYNFPGAYLNTDGVLPQSALVFSSNFL